MAALDFNNANWRTSSRTNGGAGGAGACVEVAQVQEIIGVRDTKLRGESPILTFNQYKWVSFLESVKRGEANFS